MAATATLRHLFGLKGDVKDNIQYLDESRVLYCAGLSPPPPPSSVEYTRAASWCLSFLFGVAGYNVIEYNLEKKTQKFLPLSATFANQQDVKAISGTANCRSFVCFVSATLLT
jgi:hypothetical protein